VIGFVYGLCMLTSVVVAALLLRGWRRSGARLLLWAGLCFVGLALNNVLTLIDVYVAPDLDLWTLRQVPAIAGMFLLVAGLVWDGDR
jgi:hypothetical protein